MSTSSAMKDRTWHRYDRVCTCRTSIADFAAPQPQHQPDATPASNCESLGSIAHRRALSMPCIVQAGGTPDEFDRRYCIGQRSLHRHLAHADRYRMFACKLRRNTGMTSLWRGRATARGDAELAFKRPRLRLVFRTANVSPNVPQMPAAVRALARPFFASPFPPREPPRELIAVRVSSHIVWQLQESAPAAGTDATHTLRPTVFPWIARGLTLYPTRTGAA